MLTMVSGFNFFAYQAFSGWATTYLKTVRMFSDGAIGISVSWMFAGSVIGGFFWGWVGDRFGCRAAACGFFLAAARRPEGRRVGNKRVRHCSSRLSTDV